ncbi:CYFA0S08e03796g1_1 [Cyberlindnera fabianii]|uniref:CYFA0S08e03796g1_1 n=1 Tax=Cyberlindnera fabianii TaxID=36022 RepID=A0A061AY16_CYBFA|nr:CYFA0S08e03796g1_1 [Cyberlindnera fabianii]
MPSLHDANSTMSLLITGTDTDASTIGTSHEPLPKQGVPPVEAEEVDIEDTKTGLFAILVVGSAAIGGLMFGIDTASVSSILLFLDQADSFQLTAEQKELVTGITAVGSFFGSIFASHMADVFGRRLVITICCVVFTLAGIQLSLAGTVVSLVFGRLVIGLAVGAASMVVPVYISEVAPSKKRGRLLVLNSCTTTGGQFLANVMAYLIANNENNWRLMFFFSAIPPVIFLLTVGFIPESPRYLVLKQDYSGAEKAVSRLYPNATHSQIRSKIVSIIDDIDTSEDNHQRPVHQRLFGEASTRRALVVGCALMFYQQISSFNSFMYYGATIFKSIGVGDPLVVSILISGTNFAFTFVALKYIDRVGRRAMLLRTVWIMAFALFVAAFAFLKVDAMPRNGEDPHIELNVFAIVLIISILTFVASYASALGTVPWSSVEFLPLEARAPGSAMIAAVGWLSNFLISASYLTMVNVLTETGTCTAFGMICLAGWFAIKKWYPEVNGLSLEEIRNVFRDGIDIHYAETLKQQKAQNGQHADIFVSSSRDTSSTQIDPTRVSMTKPTAEQTEVV